MKFLVVLSCVLAVAYGMGLRSLSGSGFGGYSSAHEQHSHSESHRSSSQQHVSSSGLSSGLGGIGDAYGLSGGAYDVHGTGLNAVASQSTASRSLSSQTLAAQSIAGNSFGASSLASNTLGVRSVLADSAFQGDSYGSGLQEAATFGGHGIGGLGTTGLGGYNNIAGHSASRSSHVSRSYSSSSSSSSINYQSVWPGLYDVPLFQNLCGLKSTVKSNELARTLVQSNYDYGSVFSSLYSKSSLLQKYFYAATGIQYDESYRSNYFQVINQHPETALRLANIFARNPNIFNTRFGGFLFSGTSAELLSNYQSHYQEYSYNAFSSSQFLQGLLRSKYYVSSLSRVFGYSSGQFAYEELQNRLLQDITSRYQSNPAGTLLFLRHILSRRQISSYDYYSSVRDYSAYSSNINFWRNRSWRHNPYYDVWNSKYAASSYSATSVRSTRSVSRSSSAMSSGLQGISGYSY